VAKACVEENSYGLVPLSTAYPTYVKNSSILQQ